MKEHLQSISRDRLITQLSDDRPADNLTFAVEQHGKGKRNIHPLRDSRLDIYKQWVELCGQLRRFPKNNIDVFAGLA